MPGWVTALVATVGCVAFWFTILHLVSRSFGWYLLAFHYRLRGSFAGRRRWFCWGYVGSGNYGHGLILGTNADGLYIAVIPILRPAHPPLFVPWGDVSVVSTGWLLWRVFEIQFAKAPAVTLSVFESTGKAIIAAAPRSYVMTRATSE